MQLIHIPSQRIIFDISAYNPKGYRDPKDFEHEWEITTFDGQRIFLQQWEIEALQNIVLIPQRER